MAKKAAKKKAVKRKATRAKGGAGLAAVGSVAPAFSAPAGGGKTVRLSDYRGKKAVVLYFYPRDNTPGCTREACGFRDANRALQRAGVEVLGVSPDSAASHEKFATEHSLPFTLVSDPDNAMAKAYGVWQKKMNYGRTYYGIVRSTFVIDKQGRIVKVYPRVKPDGHAEAVLEWVKGNL